MLESLRNIKSLEDIRVEKARLKYESLLAESRMMESMRAAGQLFTVVSSLKRVSGGIRTAYSIISRFSRFISRWFGRKKEEKEDRTPREEDTLRY